MSLVIALSTSREAVIAGDRRAIIFLGAFPKLEDELYSGQIQSDPDLIARARDLGASLQVSDGREKVWKRGDLLAGEVTEISPQLERRRRIYLAPGAHLIVDVTGTEARITSQGKSGCIIFGNKFTQRLAAHMVSKAKGKVTEQLIREILAQAAERTASVSREFTLLRSDVLLPDAPAAILRALKEDAQENGWRICDRQ